MLSSKEKKEIVEAVMQKLSEEVQGVTLKDLAGMKKAVSECHSVLVSCNNKYKNKMSRVSIGDCIRKLNEINEIIEDICDLEGLD